MSFTTDFLLILCQIVMVRSFLVNSSASTRVTSYEFQLLSKLILDEQTRTSHLEEDMKDLIKDQQTMKNSKVALDTQLNTTKSEQIATRQELIATRQELIATKSELNATKSELNATKRELEGQMKTLKSIKAKLDKEIINRHQLQMTYSALVTDFHNLSVSVNSNTIDIGILSHKIGQAIAFSTALKGLTNIHTGQVIVFDHIILNVGGGYDVHSGKFTCPTSGVYLITFFIGFRDHGNYQFVASLMVNNASIVEAQVEGHIDLQDLQGGNAVVVKLNKYDQIWVKQRDGKQLGSWTGRTSSFSGALLYPLD